MTIFKNTILVDLIDPKNIYGSLDFKINKDHFNNLMRQLLIQT